AVLAERRADRHLRQAAKERGYFLRARRAELEAVADPLPGDGGLRGPPATLAHRRSGIGDALVGMDILLVADGQPANRAAVDAKFRRRGASPCGFGCRRRRGESCLRLYDRDR